MTRGSEVQHEWAVRWPGGEIEEHPTRERAQNVVRLYGEPVLLSRTVTFGEWTDSARFPATSIGPGYGVDKWPSGDSATSDGARMNACTHDVRHANTGRCIRCGQNGGTYIAPCGRCAKGDSGDHDYDCLDGPDPWSRS